MFSYKRYYFNDWDDWYCEWVNPRTPRPKPASRLMRALVNKLK